MVALIQSRPSTRSAATFSLQCRENPPHSRRFGQHFSQSLQRARYYDPSTGEFTSRDPLEYVDGLSMFRGYFLNSDVDPFGLAEFDCLCTCTHWAVGNCSGGSWTTCKRFVAEADSYFAAKTLCESGCESSSSEHSGTGIGSGHSCKGKLIGEFAFCELLRSMCDDPGPAGSREDCLKDADAYCDCIFAARADIERMGGPKMSGLKGLVCTHCQRYVTENCKSLPKKYFYVAEEAVLGGPGRWTDYLSEWTFGCIGTDGHAWSRIVFRRYTPDPDLGVPKSKESTAATVDFWGDFECWWGEGRNSCGYVNNQTK